MSRRVCCGFFLAVALLPGCKKTGSAETAEGSLPASTGLKGLRCEVKKADDIEMVESAAPGSPRDNVRRFYRNEELATETRRLLVCREVDSNYDGTIDVVRFYDEDGKRATEVVDSNFDGHVDTWMSFSGGLVATLSVDKNADGKADEKRFFVDGVLARVQQDTNGDGQADRFEIYRADRLERVGVDADFDGRVDRWERDAQSTLDEEESEAQGEKEKPAATSEGTNEVGGASQRRARDQ